MTQQITPERALELAEKIGQDRDGFTIPSTAEAGEISTILRWAAEVMQTETVLWARKPKSFQWPVDAQIVASAEPSARPEGTAEFNIPLIIKPIPPATGEK